MNTKILPLSNHPPGESITYILKWPIIYIASFSQLNSLIMNWLIKNKEILVRCIFVKARRSKYSTCVQFLRTVQECRASVNSSPLLVFVHIFIFTITKINTKHCAILCMKLISKVHRLICFYFRLKLYRLNLLNENFSLNCINVYIVQRQ